MEDIAASSRRTVVGSCIHNDGNSPWLQEATNHIQDGWRHPSFVDDLRSEDHLNQSTANAKQGQGLDDNSPFCNRFIHSYAFTGCSSVAWKEGTMLGKAHQSSRRTEISLRPAGQVQRGSQSKGTCGATQPLPHCSKLQAIRHLGQLVEVPGTCDASPNQDFGQVLPQLMKSHWIHISRNDCSSFCQQCGH